MATAFPSRGTGIYPVPGNPMTAQGSSVAPPTSGALASNSLLSNAAAYAGCAGTLVINGVSIALDFTVMMAKNAVDAINAANAGVTASIVSNNRLQLTSANAIVIGAGSTAALLALMGFSAQTYN